MSLLRDFTQHMTFSDTSTKLGILQDIEMKLFGDNGYGQITSNANRLLQFTARVNRAQDRFIQLAISADGRWQYDDTNNTDYPTATTNLVANQRDYTFAIEMIQIERVAILNSATSLIYNVILPIDISDNSALAKAYIENNTNNVGVPTAYDKTANSIILQPTPPYSATNGLKVFFKRGANYFVSTDTTNKSPGFPVIFHDYLSLYASYCYAVDRTMTSQIQTLGRDVQIKEEAIIDFFSKRSKDEQKFIRPVIRNSR